MDLALEDVLDLLVIGEEAEQVDLVLEQNVEHLSGHLLVHLLIEKGREERHRLRRGLENELDVAVFERVAAGRGEDCRAPG